VKERVNNLQNEEVDKIKEKVDVTSAPSGKHLSLI
jgi:hypothetical protein